LSFYPFSLQLPYFFISRNFCLIIPMLKNLNGTMLPVNYKVLFQLYSVPVFHFQIHFSFLSYMNPVPQLDHSLFSKHSWYFLFKHLLPFRVFCPIWILHVKILLILLSPSIIFKNPLIPYPEMFCF
jgi:hypothetical protein